MRQSLRSQPDYSNTSFEHDCFRSYVHNELSAVDYYNIFIVERKGNFKSRVTQLVATFLSHQPDSSLQSQLLGQPVFGYSQQPGGLKLYL